MLGPPFIVRGYYAALFETYGSFLRYPILGNVLWIGQYPPLSEGDENPFIVDKCCNEFITEVTTTMAVYNVEGHSQRSKKYKMDGGYISKPFVTSYKEGAGRQFIITTYDSVKSKKFETPLETTTVCLTRPPSDLQTQTDGLRQVILIVKALNRLSESPIRCVLIDRWVADALYRRNIKEIEETAGDELSPLFMKVYKRCQEFQVRFYDPIWPKLEDLLE